MTEPTSPPSRCLFHYTTGDGLAGIIQNQSLYATHPDFLNDVSECKLIRDILVPIFKGELETLVPELIRRRIIDERIIDVHGSSVYLGEAENMFRCFVTVTNNISPFFITSFCEHKPSTQEYEHGLLSQWRAYGRGGFALELDERELDELIKKERKSYLYAGIKSNVVIYMDHKNHVSNEIFQGVVSALMRDMLRNGYGKDISELTGDKKIDDFFIPFVTTAPFLKDVRFIEEQEFRIVGVCFSPKTRDRDDRLPHKPIKFQTRANGMLTPYIEMFASIPDKLPIKSVIVGPHANQEQQAYAAQVLLEQSGVNATVRISRTPFRG